MNLPGFEKSHLKHHHGGPRTLSNDGTLTDPAGNTQKYEWDLTAQRE